MKLKYGAWLRNSMGRDAEDVALPPGVDDVGALLDWLARRGGRCEGALDYLDIVIVTVNSQYADRDYPVRDSDEVMLVPPIGGG